MFFYGFKIRLFPWCVMKVKSIPLFIFLLSFGLYAVEIQRSYKFKDFDSANTQQSYLKFMVKNTKVGLITSEVEGVVTDFSWKGTLDTKNKILREIELSLQVGSMTTNHEERDEKLQSFCLNKDKYPLIKLKLKGPIFLNGARKQVLNGSAFIRGVEKPISLELFSRSKGSQNNQTFEVYGETLWSFKEMEIPDPSILVAKLSDEIKVSFKITDSFSGEKNYALSR